jgi:hypothetical protein
MSVIHTTADHLFWDPVTRLWVKADELRMGEFLRSARGTAVIADGGITPKSRSAWMWDLTVPGEGDHDFYVLPWRDGDSRNGHRVVIWGAPILAHNSTCIGFANDLGAAQAANPLIESLRSTGRLPSEYVTKAQAEAAGWKPSKALGNFIPGGQLGGDPFENRLNDLPTALGRIWYEADLGINPMMSRPKQPGWRLLYSNDGLAYISSDHYVSYYQLPNWR